MNESSPVLGDSSWGGCYFPATDHMEFRTRLPDEFPFIEFQVSTVEEIHRLAVIIEEFIHRFQFHLTQLGLLYRLTCLAQSMKVFEIFRLLGTKASERLPVPWIQSSPRDENLRQLIDDLQALENMKQLLFGGFLRSDPHHAMLRTKAILEATTPLKFGNFSVWNLDKYYDPAGRPKPFRSTRAILESHASAYAFRLLERAAPAEMQRLIRDCIKTTRVGLYNSIEEIAKVCGEQPDLDVILRLGDYALDGKLIDMVGIAPPDDYIDNVLPYTRYVVAFNRLKEMREVGRKYGYKELSMIQFVEAVIDVSGDLRPSLLGPEMTPEMEKGRQVCMDDQIKAVFAWLLERKQAPGLKPSEILTITEIANSVIHYLNGVKATPVDGKKFDATPERLAILCRVCDYPIVLYGPALEVFLCWPDWNAQQICTYGALCYQSAVYTQTLVCGDCKSLKRKSDSLAKIGLPDFTAFVEPFGVSLDQII